MPLTPASTLEVQNVSILYSRNDLRNRRLTTNIWHWGNACPQSDSLRYVTTEVLRCQLYMCITTIASYFAPHAYQYASTPQERSRNTRTVYVVQCAGSQVRFGILKMADAGL